MAVKTILIISFTAVLASCGASELSTSNIAEMTFGWVEGTCLVMKGDSDIAGSDATLVSKNKASVSTQRLIGAADPESCPPLIRDPGALTSGTHRYFAVKAEAGQMFAIITSQAGSNINSDLDNVDFGSCVTGEGIMYYAVDSSTSDVVWSDYAPLGYDVEANCPGDLVFEN